MRMSENERINPILAEIFSYGFCVRTILQIIAMRKGLT